MNKIPVNFSMGLSTQYTDITQDNWKSVILNDYSDEEQEQSDYVANICEAICDEMHESTEDILNEVYESCADDLIDCMKLESMNCIKHDSDGCVMNFNVLFDIDVFTSKMS